MDTQDLIVGGFSKWPDHTPGRYCILCKFVTFIGFITQSAMIDAVRNVESDLQMIPSV